MRLAKKIKVAIDSPAAAGAGAGAKCWPVVRADVLSRSIEVPVLKEAVLKCETLLLALTPLLIVKVDVGALKLVFV